jgi:peptidoglycan/LPS O-acetylase OafA/YrhL
MNKNSLDLLRLVAAAMVLYSHQYALLGLPEPSFMGWNSFGGAGVTIFFFLSGFLVSTSWDRDPHVKRFFVRRSLRIFPGLWLVVFLTVFLLGPLLTVLSPGDYFTSRTTLRYLGTAALVSTNVLPGLFAHNPVPFVVNGSLWTLPVEFLCYCTVALIGLIQLAIRGRQGLVLGVSLLGVVMVATYGPRLIGDNFTPHLEMVADFWWGVFYGYCMKAPKERLGKALAALAMLGFAVLGPRAFERTAMLACAAVLVHTAMRISAGARLTEYFGDMSYGVYIFAFPVQQLAIHWGRNHGWSFMTYLAGTGTVTLALAYLSWHLVEKRALLLKPKKAQMP